MQEEREAGARGERGGSGCSSQLQVQLCGESSIMPAGELPVLMIEARIESAEREVWRSGSMSGRKALQRLMG